MTDNTAAILAGNTSFVNIVDTPTLTSTQFVSDSPPRQVHFSKSIPTTHQRTENVTKMNQKELIDMQNQFEERLAHQVSMHNATMLQKDNNYNELHMLFKALQLKMSQYKPTDNVTNELTQKHQLEISGLIRDQEVIVCDLERRIFELEKQIQANNFDSDVVDRLNGVIETLNKEIKDLNLMLRNKDNEHTRAHSDLKNSMEMTIKNL